MSPAMHIILSNAGWQQLGQAGITPGYLTAWLMRTGKRSIYFHHLQGNNWQTLRGPQLFIADSSELMSVAMQHGRRLGAGNKGDLQLIGARSLPMSNPPRQWWYYSQQEDLVVLASTGDLSNNRETWLPLFAQGRTLLPAHVTLQGDISGRRLIELEPGLYAHIEQPGDHMQLDDATPYLNHTGLMPEEQLLRELQKRRWRIRCAESCTAGGISQRISRVPGASAILDYAQVTYSNAAKMQLLGISEHMLQQHGAVSEAVVRAMAEAVADADTIGLAVSGIAGPDGGTAEKPVGTVWVAIAVPHSRTRSFRLSLTGSRSAIQAQVAMQALAEVCMSLKT